MVRPLALALVLALATSAQAEETPASTPAEDVLAPLPQWGRGPFEVQDPFVLGQLRGSPRARSPEVLDPLAFEVGARLVEANSYGFADDARYVIDAETCDVSLFARAGVLPRVELGVELTAVHHRGGGVLDEFIAGWHSAFGIGDQGRTRLGRDGYNVHGIESDGRAVRLPHTGTGLGDLALEVRGLAYAGSDWLPAVSGGVRLRVPTANRVFGHELGVDPTLSVDLSKRAGTWPLVFYGGAAYTYGAHETVHGFRLYRHRGMVWFGLELELFSSVSVVVHGWYETQRERKLFSNTSGMLTGNDIAYAAAALRFEPIEDLRIDLGILENIVDPDVTADFSVLLAVSYRFGRVKRTQKASVF